MTEHTIQIDATDANRYRTCGAVLLPMEPQPKRGPVFQISGDESNDWYTEAHDVLGRLLDGRWVAPHQPGDALEWRFKVENTPNWHTGYVVRRAVTSIEAKRAGDLEEDEEAMEGVAGYDGWKLFLAWWHRQHQKHPWSPDLWVWLVRLESER